MAGVVTVIGNLVGVVVPTVTAYDAVLFDNDGILVEPPTEARQLEAARHAFEAAGLADVDEDHLTAIGTGGSHDRVTEVCEALDVDADRLWRLRDEHDQRFQRADIEAGDRTTYDDIVAIGDCEAERAVVSNNHHVTVEFVLEHLGIDHLFRTYYGRERSLEGLLRTKPDPHYLECALADLGADSALYVGDRESDVVAAHSAGLDAVFVRRDHCRDVTLSTTPDHEIETLHELPALLGDGSNRVD